MTLCFDQFGRIHHTWALESSTRRCLKGTHRHAQSALSRIWFDNLLQPDVVTITACAPDVGCVSFKDRPRFQVLVSQKLPPPLQAVLDFDSDVLISVQAEICPPCLRTGTYVSNGLTIHVLCVSFVFTL